MIEWMFIFLLSTILFAADSIEVQTGPAPAKTEAKDSLAEICKKDLEGFPGRLDKKIFYSACEKVEQLDGCQSVEKHAIFHYNKNGNHKSNQRILVFSLIHGDETPAGSVGRFWMERLESITPRNSWRVVPVLNPDGVKLKTRTNANKIDLNRNFPTKDWDADAVRLWKRDTKSNLRRFPGEKGGSEPETQCAMNHIEDFKPNFIVSIHTPLKVLDYDGPKVKPPKYDYLPWRNLGTFPGSLGRYMWFERKVPVLTMELKEDLPSSIQPLVQLQDVIGFLVSLDINPVKATTGKSNPP
jgi:murein peptide amidase A